MQMRLNSKTTGFLPALSQLTDLTEGQRMPTRILWVRVRVDFDGSWRTLCAATLWRGSLNVAFFSCMFTLFPGWLMPQSGNVA